MQPSKLNQRPDMNNSNMTAPTEAKQPRNLNREIYALQEIADQLAKATAELDNSTQCVRLLEPIALNKGCPPPATPVESNVAEILKGLHDSFFATHNRLCTILRELDFDFPPES